MSGQAPQVLARRANGVLPAPANQTNDKGKESGEAATTTSSTSRHRYGRGRGAGERHGDTSKKPNDAEVSKPARTKAHHDGEKLVIRRLPPGMTQIEFASILGNEWEVGKGKTDWLTFAPGKVSTDPSKPSRPGRAYLHVTRKEHILPLSEAVRLSKWEDAQATFNNVSLVGPPVVEISIYKKVPGLKKRTDARQGTIDQDPEFMAFLEELANPPPPRENVEEDLDENKVEAKVTTTPLVEFLKEKKANKAKEAALAKSAKHSRQESGPGKGKGSKDDDSKRKGKESKTDKSEKGSKETVKILTKKAATEQAVEAAKNVVSQSAGSGTQEVTKSRRAGIAAAARILQRDLGLSPGSAHRRARQDAAKADSDSKATAKDAKETEASASVSERPASPVKSTDAGSKSRAPPPTAPKAQPASRRTRGGKTSEKTKSTGTAAASEGGNTRSASPANPPVILLKKKGGEGESAQPATSSTPSQPTKEASAPKTAPTGPKAKSGGSQKKAPPVSSDGTRAFVKHANPSQGVTEALLKQTLEAFGTITFVEIDKRKGFAYVDFAEHDGLAKAMAASPITVAQGTVQVLERKDKKANPSPAQTSAASGSAAPEKQATHRGRRGRGGGGTKANTGAAAGGGGQPVAASTGG